ncbi:MAG: Crp/Fnr family transcriptional regulator [Selenomonas sp.]|nr:Crp/Fnr family transcriptional regulator [Selenomonas sp.]MBQ7496532.1 Crp/Fnr family transcriptional regulator [Selenomonas sp.]
MAFAEFFAHEGEVADLPGLEEAAAIFQRCLLGKNMDEGSAREFLSSSQVRIRKYPKGAAVFHDGDRPEYLYVLLEGRVHIQKESFTGRRIFLSEIEEPGDVFGEVYLLLGRPYDMYVEAARETRLLLVGSRAFSLQGGERAAPALQVQQNLLRVLARKAYFMHNKLKVLSSGTLREKIIRFLFWSMDGEGTFRLDCTRETWADYFSVARPSLSRELSALQAEGILQVQGRLIKVLDKGAFEAYL